MYQPTACDVPEETIIAFAAPSPFPSTGVCSQPVVSWIAEPPVPVANGRFSAVEPENPLVCPTITPRESMANASPSAVTPLLRLTAKSEGFAVPIHFTGRFFPKAVLNPTDVVPFRSMP
ncbi:MAG: hypothetical protein J0L84_09795 [Verrucomicrobia bacterium]|nr:hypothetical protein [Verrucomicrobiota bacterium]